MKERLLEERKEKEEYAKKVGQLTMSVDWLKKNLKKFLDQTTRVNLLKSLTKSKEISISTASTLLDVNRTSAYYKKPSPSEKERKSKKLIDKLHTDNLTWGSRQMSEQLKKSGINVGRKLTRRYMAEMDRNAIYPKMNLSKRIKQAKVCPYLLREAKIADIS